MTLAESVGKAIKERRTRWPYEMSIKELSSRTGIRPPTLYSYESGQRLPSLPALIKIAKVINLDLNTLGVPEDHTAPVTGAAPAA